MTAALGAGLFVGTCAALLAITIVLAIFERSRR